MHEGKKCAVCTDIGHVDKRMLHLLGGSDILLLEANHDVDMLMAGPYPYALKQRILSGRAICAMRTAAGLWRSCGLPG